MKREEWIDRLRGWACFLVAVFHALQGLQTAGIKMNPALFGYFNATTYLYHMPVFFFVSGYLYRRGTPSFQARQYPVLLKAKLLSLGIPYFFFYVAFVLTNMLMSDSVNQRMGKKELLRIFGNPITPYWFLYTLFFLFAFVPLLHLLLKRSAFVLAAACCLKILSFFSVTHIYAVDGILKWSVYFCLGIVFCDSNRLSGLRAKGALGFAVSVLFLPASILFYLKGGALPVALRELTAVFFAVGGIIFSHCLLSVLCRIGCFAAAIHMISKYSFQIYLLHTVFSAGLRILLLKANITSFWIQTPIGISAGILIPALISAITAKSPYLNFVFFPAKSIAGIRAQRIRHYTIHK